MARFILKVARFLLVGLLAVDVLPLGGQSAEPLQNAAGLRMVVAHGISDPTCAFCCRDNLRGRVPSRFSSLNT